MKFNVSLSSSAKRLEAIEKMPHGPEKEAEIKSYPARL
jgi:hypothetical protein